MAKASKAQPPTKPPPTRHPATKRPTREPPAAERHESGLSFLFDLDGTLVDSVYQHVLSWHEALQAAGIPLSIWRIHRRIGMSGGLFANALPPDLGRPISPALIHHLRPRQAG